MKRQGVQDGNWFDIETATKYDASNMAGDALYKTENGNFILGTLDTDGDLSYERKTKEIAYQWLLENNHSGAIPEAELENLRI